MFEFLQLLKTWYALLPEWIIFLIIVFLILPTLFGLLVRVNLYQHLVYLEAKVKKLIEQQSIGREPTIIEQAKRRLQEVSQRTEQVNTIAIVESLYRQEKFRCLVFSLHCETWDRISSILPNLLLTLGLLGTFLGISINLSEISQTLNQTDVSNLSLLIEELRLPLQGMGIAFSTSLLAVFCSATQTLVNSRQNSAIAKSQLLSMLEDYLDNTYLPLLPSYSRLDRALDRMSEQQQEFLTRFHENVTAAVEASLGRVAQQIADGNRESTNLARQVYEQFRETSGTLDRGAVRFESTVTTWQEQVNRFQEFSQRIHQASKIFATASDQIERSKFSENLERLTSDLAQTQAAYSQTTQTLSESIPEIIAGNERASQLAARVYHQFDAASTTLSQSANVFHEATEILQNSHAAEQIASATKDLATAQTQLIESMQNFQALTQLFQIAIETLQEANQKVVEIGEQTSQLNHNLQEGFALTYQRLGEGQKSLDQISTELSQLAVDLDLSLNRLGDHVGKNLKGFSDRLDDFISEYQNSNAIHVVIDKIENSVAQLKQIRDVMADLSKLYQGKETSDSSHKSLHINNSDNA